MSQQQRCVWCGEPLDRAGAGKHKTFCRECHETFEREKQRPYHTQDERHAYPE
ncbi:MAG TPA: hypothetical protein VD969_09995 [Symbiobacteriaceae bacterium]|nr:hypothetical protein [Symbiobacteriaceae bacterium]